MVQILLRQRIEKLTAPVMQSSYPIVDNWRPIPLFPERCLSGVVAGEMNRPPPSVDCQVIADEGRNVHWTTSCRSQQVRRRFAEDAPLPSPHAVNSKSSGRCQLCTHVLVLWRDHGQDILFTQGIWKVFLVFYYNCLPETFAFESSARLPR